jgi:hypothetical protein
MNSQRQKRTCWGCRALTVSCMGAVCRLGYSIALPEGAFFRPQSGQICPKPGTYGKLRIAVIEPQGRIGDVQLPLL